MKGVLIFVLLLGCSRCARQQPAPPSPPPPPTNLALAWHSQGAYLATWVSPTATFTHFEMQGRVNGAAWTEIGGDPLLPTDTSTTIFADAGELDELDVLEVRMRCVVLPSGVTSDWSNIASVREHILPGVVGVTSTFAGTARVAPIAVSVVTNSRATELQLARAESDELDTPVSAWTTLPVAKLSDLPYSDSDVVDATRYVYRASWGSQGFWSDPAIGGASLDVKAPAGLTTSIIDSGQGHPAGIHLAWTNASARADRLRVEGITTAVLAPPQSSYDDLSWPFWPTAFYTVTAWRNFWTMSAATSEPVGIPGYAIAGPLTFDASIVSAPFVTDLVRDPLSGAIFGLDRFSDVVYRPTGDSWEGHAAGTMAQGLALDGAGHPHLMALAGSPPSYSHVYYDGAAWHTDAIASSTAGAAAFVVTPAGAAHLILRSDATLTDWTNESGAWAATDLPAIPEMQNPLQIAGQAGPDGSAYVTVAGYAGQVSSITLASRAPGAAWSSQPVSGGDGAVYAWLIPNAAGHTALIAAKFAAPDYGLWYLAPADGGWAAAEHIDDVAVGNAPPVATAAGDTARAFFLISRPDGCALYSRNTAWSSMIVGSRCNAEPIGVHPDGKLWIIGATSRDPAHRASLLEERQ